MTQTPKWLDRLERSLGWISVPYIAVLLITLQVMGFIMISSNPGWYEQLALIPSLVFAGEYWRVITFLAIPLTISPIWMFFVLWFLYFIVNALESTWGAFKTTFYILISVLITVTYSLLFYYPIAEVHTFEATLFLAAAILYPDYEILLFFILPVKLKWLGLLTGALIIYQFFEGTWPDRFYILSLFSNFLLFFGPGLVGRTRQLIRKWNYKRKL